MIELEELARQAALPLPADERALPSIPLPDRAFDVGRDEARVGDRAALGWPRLPGRGELPPLELGDERIEGAVEHLADLARGDGMAEQRLGVLQLLVRGLPDGEVEREALGRVGPYRRARGGDLNMRRRMVVGEWPDTLRRMGSNLPRGNLLVRDGRRGGDRLYQRKHFRPRELLREKLLDLELAPMGRGFQQPLRVLRGQVRGQQNHRTETQPS